MKLHKSIKSILLVLVTSSIYGCGGDSGETTQATSFAAQPTPTLTISLADNAIDLAEKESGNISVTVNYTGDGTLTVTLTSDNENVVTGTASENEIVIQASDVTAIQNQGVLTLEVTDGKLSATETVSVNVRNTSFFEMQDTITLKAESLINYAGADMSSANVLLFLTDVSYRTGLIDESTFETVVSQRVTKAEETNADFASSMTSILEKVGLFTETSDGSDDDLAELEVAVGDATTAYLNSINEIYSGVKSTDGSLLPTFDLSNLFSDQISYSLFIGNPQMGVFENDKWKFNEAYEFLKPLLLNPNICYEL